MKYSLMIILLLVSILRVSAQNNSMMIRVAELEIDSNYLEDYKKILKEESEASVRLEPGVISIYPMYQNSTQRRSESWKSMVAEKRMSFT